jgi:hypothetical protein
MSATACTLAAVLMFEAAASPPATEECPLTDNRCKAGLYERRAATAPTPAQRALYLYGAYRSYLLLFEKTGDLRDLCAARRALDASLAVAGQPPGQRALSRDHAGGPRVPRASERRTIAGASPSARASRRPTRPSSPVVPPRTPPARAEPPADLEPPGGATARPRPTQAASHRRRRPRHPRGPRSCACSRTWTSRRPTPTEPRAST